MNLRRHKLKHVTQDTNSVRRLIPKNTVCSKWIVEIAKKQLSYSSVFNNWADINSSKYENYSELDVEQIGVLHLDGMGRPPKWQFDVHQIGDYYLMKILNTCELILVEKDLLDNPPKTPFDEGYYDE